MSPVERYRGGCYFKVVDRDSCVSVGRYSCVSGSMVDRRLLL